MFESFVFLTDKKLSKNKLQCNNRKVIVQLETKNKCLIRLYNKDANFMDQFKEDELYKLTITRVKV